MGERSLRRSPTRSTQRRVLLMVRISYVAAVAVVAALGVTSTTSKVLILVATVVTLPSGLTAIVAYYLVFGLFNAYGPSVMVRTCAATSCRSDQVFAGLWGDAFDVVVVMVFAGAAAVNLVIMHRRDQRRRARVGGT